MDQNNIIQGPFHSELMKNWFEQSFFDLNIKIKSDKDLYFVTIGEKKPPPVWFPCFKFLLSTLKIFKSVFVHVPQLEWFYMAKGRKSIGPFLTSQIVVWHRDGYFNDYVRIRLLSNSLGKWKSISETICFFRSLEKTFV